jgi:hypothetical protein
MAIQLLAQTSLGNEGPSRKLKVRRMAVMCWAVVVRLVPEGSRIAYQRHAPDVRQAAMDISVRDRMA